MAQWIPKTAWKNQSLNKLYGIGELGLHMPKEALAKAPITKTISNKAVPFMAAPFRPVPSVFTSTNESVEEGKKMLKQAYDSKVPFIDLRDAYEAETKPLKRAIQLHPHDLLSGAANDILPQDRRNARLVVFASSTQRVLNGYKALRRWGFESVVVTNYDVVADFDNNAQQQ
jgi:hypothetical protein